MGFDWVKPQKGKGTSGSSEKKTSGAIEWKERETVGFHPGGGGGGLPSAKEKQG